MSVQQPQDSLHLLFRIFSGLFVVVHNAQGGEHPGTSWRNDVTVSKADPLHHLSCRLWRTSSQLLIAYIIGNGIALKHTESIITLKCWNLAGRKFSEKFRGAVGLAKVEVGWCGEHADLSPVRWKVFQCLLIEGENSGEDALREAERFLISNEEFETFLERHKEVSCLVPESNQKMKDSYLILDEYMRFLNCTGGRKDPSKSILDVGVEEAIKFSGFDEKMFLKRGGKYVWSKADLKLDW